MTVLSNKKPLQQRHSRKDETSESGEKERRQEGEGGQGMGRILTKPQPALSLTSPAYLCEPSRLALSFAARLDLGARLEYRRLHPRQ